MKLRSVPREKTIAVAQILSIMLLIFLASSMLRPLIDIKLKLAHINNTYIGRNAMMWEAGSLIGALILLPLLHRISSRRLLRICLVLFIAMILASSMIITSAFLFPVRFLMGCLAALINLTCIAGILEISANRGHATVLAVITASSSGTKALGSALTGYIGFEGSFSFFIIASLILLALVTTGLGNIRNTKEQREPYLKLANPKALPVAAGWIIVLLICAGACRNALITFLPIHAVEIGLRPEIGTMLLSSSFLGALILTIPLGRLGDSFGHRGTLAVTAVSVVGASVALLKTDTFIGLLIASAFLLGGGLVGIRDLGIAFWTSRRDNPAGVLAWCSLASGIGSGLGIVGTGALMDTIGESALGWVVFSAGLLILFISIWANKSASYAREPLSRRRDNIAIRTEEKGYLTE